MTSTTSIEDAHPDLQQAVRQAAKAAVARFDRAGLTQAQAEEHAWTWVMDHAGWVQSVIDDYPTRWPRVVQRLLRSECEALTEAHHYAAMGSRPWDAFYYTPGAVETALRAAYHPSGWMDGPMPDMPGLSSYRPVTPHSDWTVTLADIGRAMKALDAEERLIVEALYGQDVPNNKLAEACGVSKQTMSDRKEGILRRLVEILGGSQPRRQCREDCVHPERPLLAAA